MAANAAKNADRPKSVITKEQWAMPVSFDREGRPVSLRDYIAGTHNALPFPSLSDEQRLELAALRLEMQPKYRVGSIGAGMIDQKRAVSEVRGKTELGRRLAEVEIRVIVHLLEEAERQSKSQGKPK